MKFLKKLLTVLVCVMLVQIPASVLGNSVTVQAATAKSGLVKEGSDYYYYSSGKKTKNKWVNKVYVGKDSKGNKVYQKMYFGSDGKAYRAKTANGRFVVKTISGKKYGFDKKGYLLGKSLYVDLKTEKFYFFNSTGTVNTSISKKFNEAAEYKAGYKALSDLLKKYGFKPKKTSSVSTCFPDKKYLGGKDVTYTYDNFYIGTLKDKNGKNELFIYAESR